MKKKLCNVILLFTVFFIAHSSNSFARVYYLSSTYSGTLSNGNLSTPWKSIADLQNNQGVILPGDTISFKKGDTFSGKLSISKSGTSANPIVFNSYGFGSKPVFIGNGTTITYLFYLYNKNYIVFDDLEITDPSISLSDRTIPSKIQRAFGFDGTSAYNTIKNCTISRVGIGAYWVGPNNSMDHCDIGNLRMVVNDVGGDNDYGANPIVISSAGNRITNNYFHDCWANSYDYLYDGGAIEFYGNGSSNNFIGYNTFYDCNGVVENGSGNGGLIENNEFSYNKFINNGSLFYISNGGTYVVTVSNMKFYNNVIIENVVDRLSEVSMGAMKNNVSTQGVVVFKNNVFCLSNGVDVVRYGQWTAGQLIHENNLYKLSNNSITNYSLQSSELSSSQILWNNTTNSNPTLWDLSPSTNSPLIDHGQNLGFTYDINRNPIINLPDIGVIEKQSLISVNPAELIINTSYNNILCNGDHTTLTISAAGGTPPYIGTGLYSVAAGTYIYSVSDSNGTIKNTTVTISQPTPILFDIAAGAISNYGSTTTITINASGGTGNYQYQLNNGPFQLSNIFTNITAGTYTITVKDQNGCIKSNSVTINQPEPLSIQIQATPILCNGSLSRVTISASGGVLPYAGTGIFNVTSGSYVYVVSDALGNVIRDSIVIDQPDQISFDIIHDSISTNGGATNLSIQAYGGTNPLAYQINNGAYQSSSVFYNLTAGNYLVNVKDINSCMLSKLITITQPVKVVSNLVLLLVTKRNISCRRASDGYIEVQASGGVPPYWYSINGSIYQSSNKFSNLKAGNYLIKAKDSLNNTAQIYILINDTKKRCNNYLTNKSMESVLNNGQSEEVNIYPNPTQQNFHIHWNTTSNENILVMVVNMYGEKVYQAVYKPSDLIIFGMDFKPGVYFAKIRQGEFTKSIKLIKI